MIPSTPTGLVVKNKLDITNARRSPDIRLSWTANTESDLTGYRIYRNYVPYGTFKLVATVAAGVQEYTDQTTLTTSPSMPGDSIGIFQTINGMWYYRISAYSSDGESGLTAPLSYVESDAYANDALFTQGYSVGGVSVSYQGSTSCDLPSNSGMLGYFNQIRDRNIWLLLQDGKDVWLFKRRKEGMKCPHWEDDIHSCAHPLGTSGDLTDACYGTGFIGGYYEPVKIRIRHIANHAKVALESEGMRVEHLPKAWTIWTPGLANFDFIVTNEGQRFEIKDVNSYQVRGGLVTHQDFSLIQKWETDWIFSVPVPEEL